MIAEDVPARAARAGARLREQLTAVPGVATVRGEGLLLAAELDEGIDAKQVAGACLTAGLVVNSVTATAVRFAPSLLVTDAELDAAVAIFSEVLA
jgi:acetylornithine/succinyldiaminopimelate/putrescine aminotransferase